MKATPVDPTAGELPADAFARLHVRPRPGRTLIVGSRIYGGRPDRRRLYADAVGVDMQAGDGVDVVADLTQPQPGLGAFDHIECMSVLEHCPAPWAMAAVLAGMLIPGGTIHVVAPFVHRVHAYPDDFWRFTPAAIEVLFPTAIAWDALMLASDRLHDGTRVTVMKIKNHPYLARAETHGFGRRT